ncbi:class I SAM-dependent methyltransferase [Fulvivirgaceae bacterium LMO-SS25]
MLDKILHKLFMQIPSYKERYNDHNNLRNKMEFPPGHYYSPCVTMDELREFENIIWRQKEINEISAIDFNAEAQKDFLKALKKNFGNLRLVEKPTANNRYYLDNGFYSYTDGIILSLMISHLQPKRIIEVGSGYSSALMLDLNDQLFKSEIELTFIEPYTERLDALIERSENRNTQIIRKKVQEIDLSIVEKLESNDILFIDSSHVSKVGSDLNFIVFEILPKLRPGVFIHFHDIFYPFEYPKEWIKQGKSWNEIYILRSFLMYNNEFRIKLFADYLHKKHPQIFSEIPLCYKNTGGNLWLEKL